MQGAQGAIEGQGCICTPLHMEAAAGWLIFVSPGW
jgi:hypothetical protein